MALEYRGIWQDSRDALIEASERTFARWLSELGIGTDLPDEGRIERSDGVREIRIQVRRAISADIEAVQLELTTIEVDPGSTDSRGRSHLTRLTAMDGGPGQRWVWVDIDREATTGTGWPLLEVPSLVHTLIVEGVDVRVDQVRLTRNAQRIAPAGLAGLIRNPGRTLPLVVLSSDPVAGTTATMRRAEEMLRHLAGAVQVVWLQPDDADAFRDRIGAELAVTDGDARVYLPNTGPSGLEPDRHRHIRFDQIAGSPTQATKVVLAMLTATITGRRPPGIYESVRRELRLGRSRNDAELLAVAEAEIERLSSERDELKDEREYLKEMLLNTEADLEGAVIDVARLQNQLQAMLVGSIESEEASRTADLSHEASSISEAIAMARERLDMVVIPPGVERDIEDLDANVNSGSWGARTWQALRALHIYASEDHDGDFRHWCATSGHVWAWPATDKKLALRESETVMSNKRFAEQRRFVVDPMVDPSGSIIMWSHLKISEGGGPMAPRIYFHDDTRGTTGKIHVGFVGPHRYTENTRTN